MIRILHVLTAMDRAGTESLLMSLYRNVDKEHIQFDFAVSTDKECDFDKEIAQLGGKIFHYPRYRGVNHYEYTKWWKNFFKNDHEHYIIHGHIGSTAAIYLKIAKKYGRYTIAHSHNTNSKASISSILYRLYSYRTRYIADYFFGCSKQALIDRYGKKIAYNSNISSVFNNAIDSKKFTYNSSYRRSIRDELSIDSDMFVIGTVGRLSEQKNPFMIINIVKRLVESGMQFKFIWVGRGELETQIKDKINELNLTEFFIFTGIRNDIEKILQCIDVFVFPSIWEGLGISCVEAQAAGLPTLCSESVPIDAKVTENIKFLPLKNLELWCDTIIDIKKLMDRGEFKRKDESPNVINANYDIFDVSEFISNFYKNITLTSNQ